MLNSTDPADRRKIRLIEDNAKCRHLKKWPGKGLCGSNFSVRGPLLSSIPPPSLLHNFYRYISLLIHTGKRGSVEPESKGEGQQGRVQITKLGRKYQHYLLYARKSINSVCCTGKNAADHILEFRGWLWMDWPLPFHMPETNNILRLSLWKKASLSIFSLMEVPCV